MMQNNRLHTEPAKNAGPADYHPLCCPALPRQPSTRMQQTIPSASKLASGLAPDPPHIMRHLKFNSRRIGGQVD